VATVRAHARRGTRGVRQHLRGVTVTPMPAQTVFGEPRMDYAINPVDETSRRRAFVFENRKGRFEVTRSDSPHGFAEYARRSSFTNPLRAIESAARYVRGED